MDQHEYEHLVIGFGKGGKTLASHLGRQGKTVALVETAEAMYGGTCINIACIPSKAFALSAAEAARYQFETFDERAAYYRAALAEKETLVAHLRQRNYSPWARENLAL